MQDFDFDKSIDHAISAIESLKKSRQQLFEASKSIIDTLKNGGTIFFAGNGGSAADAQHAAAELVGKLGLGIKRPPLRAIALTTDTSALTAIANDFGFDEIFSRQLEALAKPGDVLVAISTSGNSKNVLQAARYARSRSIEVISLLGKDSKCSIAKFSDYNIFVDGENTPQIQSAHGLALHIICEIVERNFQE